MREQTPQNRLKVAFKCPPDFKTSFKDSQCSLTISVGQEYHEGEKLLATITAINKAFNCCHIMVCDTLQRHTMAILSNKSMDDLYQESLVKGDAWIEKNKFFISKFNIRYNLIRWNRWLDDSKFQESYKKALYHYDCDDAFKAAMDITINDFFVRLNKRETGRKINYDDIYKHCFDYLIEECAVQLLWSEYPYHFEIYPHDRNPILSYCYKTLIEPMHPDVLRPVALKFKKLQVNNLEIA